MSEADIQRIVADFVLGTGAIFENEGQARARVISEVAAKLPELEQARVIVAELTVRKASVSKEIAQVFDRVSQLSQEPTESSFNTDSARRDKFRENLRRLSADRQLGRQVNEKIQDLLVRIAALKKQIAAKKAKLERDCGEEQVLAPNARLTQRRVAGLSGDAQPRNLAHNNPSVSGASAYASPYIGIRSITKNGLMAGLNLREWRNKQGLGTSGNGDGGLLADPRFNLFFSSAVNFGNNGDQDSFNYSLAGGFSYLIAPHVNIGVAGRYAGTDIDGAVASFDAETWGISLFAQSQFALGAANINLDGIVAYSETDLDAVFNNLGVITTATLENSVFSGQLKASTAFDFEGFKVSPFVSLSFVETRQEAFLLSDAQLAPGVFDDNLIFSAGSSFGNTYVWEDQGLTLKPSVGFGIFGNDSLGVSFSSGLGVKSQTGVKADLGFAYSDSGSGVDNFTISGRLTIPLN